MKIGIKIGSALLTNGRGKINKKFILSLCQQISTLLDQGHQVFLVTSGAVASAFKKGRSKNLNAAIGQVRLMTLYDTLFKILKIDVAQILLTDADLREGRTGVTKRTILEAFEEGVVTIINGNDPVDDEELRALEKLADNDELFKLTCMLVRVDKAIIGIDQLGLLNSDKKVVRNVTPNNIEKALSFARKGGKLGHGSRGMHTKVKVCGELANAGIPAMLVPGKERDFILRAVDREKNFGTLFEAK